jgi:hypothetical protein
MASLYRSAWAKRYKSHVYGDCAGDVVVNEYEYSLTGALVLNDIIEIGALPAFHQVVDVILVTDDLDTDASPAVKLDVGIMSGTYGDNDGSRTCGNEFFAADTTAPAGGVARMTAKGGFRVDSVDYDRGIGVKVNTAPATGATTGKINLLVFSAPVQAGY